MKIADCFIDILSYLHELKSLLEQQQPDWQSVRDALERLLASSKECAENAGCDKAVYQQALFPVVAFADEQLLCSNWQHKAQWQRNTLQKQYFGTTNGGVEFYQRLSQLSKKGRDIEIREVYALCLGMGFKGKYFSIEDQHQYENIKEFNLSCLLPDQAQRNLETATLFPMAYAEDYTAGNGGYKPRANIIPYVIGIPSLILLVATASYHFMIIDALNDLVGLVK